MIEDHLISSLLIAGLTSFIIYLLIQNRWLSKQAQNLLSKNYDLEEISSLKNTQLSTISHEIRNPISALIGIHQKILRNRLLPIEDRELLEGANASATSLLEILNRNLDFSKIQAGKFALSEEPCDLKNILASIFRSFSESAKQSDIQFDIHICEQIAQSLFVDAIRLRQILHNLISNAIKFSKHRQVRIHTRVISDDHFAQLIFFEIADTGKGIPHLEITRLRKPFEQLIDMKNNECHGYESGTGLGLYITEHLLSLMNSQLEIYSEEHQGTSVNFTLALQRSLEQPNYAVEKNTSPITILPIEKNQTVLVIDDHLASQLITANQFKEMGYCVHTANCGKTALAMMAEIEFDLVITDFSMPNINGTHLAKIIHNQYGKKIRIFGITAHTNGPDELLNASTPFGSILIKPASIHDWIKEINLQDNYLKSLNKISLDYPMQTTIAKELLATQVSGMEFLISANWHKNSPLREKELKPHLHKIKGGAKLIGDTQLEKYCQIIEDRRYSSIHVAEKNLRIALAKSNRILRDISGQI